MRLLSADFKCTMQGLCNRARRIGRKMRQAVYLTPRDIGMEIYSVEDIAYFMKPRPPSNVIHYGERDTVSLNKFDGFNQKLLFLDDPLRPTRWLNTQAPHRFDTFGLFTK